MSAEKGSAFLLKVGKGATPRIFATVAGMRTTPLGEEVEACLAVISSRGFERRISAAAPGRVYGRPTG